MIHITHKQKRLLTTTVWVWGWPLLITFSSRHGATGEFLPLPNKW